MRTPKRLYPQERIIYQPELSSCPHCAGPLARYNYLAWDKLVQTLGGVLSVASRPGHCSEPTCPGYVMRLRSARGQQVALLGSTYGYDVLVHIGWLRQERHATCAEIQEELSAQVRISESHVYQLYQYVYLPLLACQERQRGDLLAQSAKQHGGLIIALDGLAPEGGEPQLWFIRELLTGLTLRSGWLSRQDQPTFEAFLTPLSQLDFPVLAALSDKQQGLMPAVASVFPKSRHQFCQAHYLSNLARPLAEADATFKVQLGKAVREEVGELIRQEPSSATTQGSVLSVTGLLPDPPKEDLAQASSLPEAATEAESSEADGVVAQLLRRTRYLLTLKGRPPFRLAGIETYTRLEAVAGLTRELLAHRHDWRLVRLYQGIENALAPYTLIYQDLEQGASWLRDIASILEPPLDRPTTGEQVAQQLETYLDDLPNLPSRLKRFRSHLDKVTDSYWPGLFHCYDIAGLSRTNNELESHFRDTQRRLLRTTGQKGQSRRALQRTGAWELLTRASSEAESLAALRQVPQEELAQEQRRFRQHRGRFRTHTRSAKRAEAQLGRLRQQWLALAATSTG